MTEENYEDLENLPVELKVDGLWNEQTLLCKVGGIDRDIGLSIIMSKDQEIMYGTISSVFEKDEEILCLHGKSSQHRYKYEQSYRRRGVDYNLMYHHLFNQYVMEIMEGIITTHPDGRPSILPGNVFCSFK